ncbi:PREDICTED: NF-kappa-B inhibitor-interacting Ras-like protein isoform X2 [Ceratosolen solmsi marchali]|nr:PREDICTED: NF-kappa-B inhibitor-interacting Ras-like protein isoform X2 [Ceratosolen solmsi marchali]XP_011502718.1 PREDICTED: NF-kappa-B inhibitor-interacting Ras-like protein isoform X2 [Ceratosolen solmsi marchali]
MGKTTRVIICGMKSVGKTSLLEQLVYGNITPKSKIYPTIEDIYVINIETDKGIKEKIRFYDTAGLEPLQTSTNSEQLARHYLGFADGYILMYDTCKSESLDLLLSIKKDIEKYKDKKEIIIIVIGNRTMLNTDNYIENTIKATNWCIREKIKHFEVNVMYRPSLYEALIHLSSRLNPVPNKGTFPQLSMGRKIGKAE